MSIEIRFFPNMRLVDAAELARVHGCRLVVRQGRVCAEPIRQRARIQIRTAANQ